VTYLANSSGGTDAAYRYDPFGRWLAQTGPYATANVMRFSSKPWVGFAGSATSGLYYYGYRFYDPYLQRWVKRDPIGELGGWNLYCFSDNAPYGLIDPQGLAVLPWLSRRCKPTWTAGGPYIPLTCKLVENRKHVTEEGRCAFRICVYICVGGGYGDESNAIVPQEWVRIQDCKQRCPPGDEYKPRRPLPSLDD
jgi:RHS repeat-associated protein